VHDLGLGELLALEVLVGEIVVDVRDGLDQRLAMLLRLVEEVRRDLGVVEGAAAVCRPATRARASVRGRRRP